MKNSEGKKGSVLVNGSECHEMRQKRNTGIRIDAFDVKSKLQYFTFAFPLYTTHSYSYMHVQKRRQKENIFNALARFIGSSLFWSHRGNERPGYHLFRIEARRIEQS